MEPVTKETHVPDYQKTVMRVSRVSIIVNLLLSVSKLLAGILAHSGAMVSDAIHSASDVCGTLVVMVGVALAGKKSDQDHPYGHERMECVASILLAVFLALIGAGIGFSGLKKILGGNYEELQIPGLLALIAAVVSIVVKEWMYWYTRINARRINSTGLMAEAWHHRSDSLSSIGAFIGILGARIGYPVLDPLASFIICLFILKAALDIFRDACNKMVDHACDKETEQKIKKVAASISGVGHVDHLQTRLFGARAYVDIEIAADGALTLNEAHKIAENVHDAIEINFPEVKHCMVHVNPIEENSPMKENAQPEEKSSAEESI